MLSNYYQLGSILALAVAFSFILANLFSNKRASFFVVLLFIVMGFFIAIKYVAPNQYNKIVGNISKIDLYTLIAGGVIAFLSILSFIASSNKKYRQHLLIKNGINCTDNNFVAYLNKKHKLIQISKKLEVINKKISEKDQQLGCKQIVVNGEEIALNTFNKVVANSKGTTDAPTNVKVVYASGMTEEMNLVLKPVYKYGKKVLGYILIDNTNRALVQASTSEFKKNLYIYLDMLNQPLAYFDSDEEVFVVTRNLSEFLSLKNNRLSMGEFKKLVHKEDYDTMSEPKLENNKIKNVFMRLQTKVGYTWFEELVASFNNYEYILLRKADLSKLANLNVGSYESLVNSVNHYCEEGRQFGLVMINFANIPHIIAEYGQEVADILVNKFINNIVANILNNQAAIYKVGSLEYMFLIDKTVYLDLIVRELANKTTELLAQELIVNKYKIKVNSQMAVVYSKDVKKLDTSTVLKATFDTLKEASDPEFYKPYSIYQPKEEKEFSLADLGIDLDTDLSEFEK